MRRTFFFLLLSVSVSVYSQHHHETSAEKKSPQIIIFMAVDCPITQKYMTTIKEIAKQLEENQVTVTGYFPSGLSKKEESTFRAEYQIPQLIKLVDDKKHVWTEKLDAKVTPEVFVVINDQVAYRGAIDNWFYELGRYRLEITDHYLIDAVNASLEGKKPKVAETDAIGCFIQRSEKKTEHEHHH
jgi:thiol-disulfide isomerase/thioredoxin